LRQQLQHIRALTQRELKRARIAGVGVPGQRVLLNREAADLVETLRRIYRDREIRIETRIPPESGFAGDRDDLLELLGNLLDNACQWATTRVCLTANLDSQNLRLCVEDDGPGCPPEQIEWLQQRATLPSFSRGNSSNPLVGGESSSRSVPRGSWNSVRAEKNSAF